MPTLRPETYGWAIPYWQSQFGILPSCLVCRYCSIDALIESVHLGQLKGTATGGGSSSNRPMCTGQLFFSTNSKTFRIDHKVGGANSPFS